MNPILVLFAHPALERSRLNQSWVDGARQLSHVTVHDLYELYPEFDVDPRAEQELLEQYPIIVLQHPLYWYSTPALVKQWLDIVLEHGWAYGTGGDALRGKRLLSAVTAGGDQDAYQAGGFHDITLDELLAPLRQTARLCGMEYLKPHVGFGTFAMNEKDVAQSAADYMQRLVELGEMNLGEVELTTTSNDHGGSDARR